MASVRVEVRVQLSAGAVWEAIADVGAVHRRLLPGRVADARLEGDTRILTMPGGSVVRELILAVDHEARRMAYAVVGGQRMPLAFHHASFQVFDEGAGSRLVWITDVLPHDAAQVVRPRVQRAIEEMKRALERGAGHGVGSDG